MWVVDIIESERGWGQRVDETKYFISKEIAEKFVEEYNKEYGPRIGPVPDWYMIAMQPYWVGYISPETHKIEDFGSSGEVIISPIIDPRAVEELSNDLMAEIEATRTDNSFESWLKELNQEYRELGYKFDVVEQTGSDAWIGYFENGLTPKEAALEDLGYA